MKLVSGDKQDWVHLYSMITKTSCLLLPADLKQIDELEAKDIASWVLHSINVDFSYSGVCARLSVREIGVKAGLRPTWLKLLRGHWCLVASADDAESELSLWEIIPRRQMKLAAKIYLDAPVMDGEVDCADDSTRCAITVGAKQPYILVLGLSQSSGSVSILQLAHLPNVSCVVFLEGDFLGVAARAGDDTYPYLINWETGQKYCLSYIYSNPGVNCPLPIESCKALAMKKGFIFSLHQSSIHVFDAGTLKHLSALPLGDSAAHGRFSEELSTPNGRVNRASTIHLTYFDVYTQIHQVTISINSEHDLPNMFSIDRSILGEIDEEKDLHLCHVGAQAGAFFCLMSSDDCSKKPSALFVTPREQNDEKTCQEVGYVVINDEELPALQRILCVDFDDGNGLLLVGTTSGNVQLASVLAEPIITPESRRCSLGDDIETHHDPRYIYEAPVHLDLPLYYSIRQAYHIGDELPGDVIQRASAEWTDSALGNVHIDGWSNDWSKFTRVWDWILPLSRWGPLDRDFLDKTESVIFRNRLQSIGEVIPVLYRVENHCEVLFRIGRRLFYLRRKRKDDDADDFYSDIDPFRRIGVLPFTYEMLFTDPVEIKASLETNNVQTNLTKWEEAGGLYREILIAAFACSDTEW